MVSTIDFPGIAHNQPVKDQLSLAVAENRLPHAILFDGPPGSGHHAFAHRLAMAAVCGAPAKQRPCLQCPHCVKALAHSHPDIRVIEGGAGPRSLHVDVIREIRSDAFIKPNEAERKVYLLFDAHTMSAQAQNALLKVLEEPPAQALFVLTCPSASSLLATVRSRTQVFSLEPPDLPPDDESAAAACQAGEIARAITAPAETALLSLTASLIRDRARCRLVLSHLSGILRDACVRRAGGLTILSGQREAVMSLCQNTARHALSQMFEAVRKAQNYLEGNVNPALLLTTLCARLRKAAGK